ncbi:MAG: glycerol kinase GlpK [Clostridia bacterium]|nr:glycerol kinase GlpK [Clostridia bacterium]
MKKYIIGIDEGTTSTRAVLYDCLKKEIVNIKNQKFSQFYPNPVWVEQNAEEIFDCVVKTINDVLLDSNVSLDEILSFAITNQRETVVAWDKNTLKPVYNAIVWQCRRTSDFCANLDKDCKDLIRKKTGLLVDPYFSASKMKWILDNVELAKSLNDCDNLRFGTIDTYLMARLSNGNIFATDVTNASRTMLMNIKTCDWDDELLNIFNIKKSSLPTIKECSDDFGLACFNNHSIPILGVIGDQQSSLFGQGCFNQGQGKNTFGTGCFILINTGDKLEIESNNMLSTIAWKLNGKVVYALEGSVFNAGSCIDWAKNDLKLFNDYKLVNECLENNSNPNGIYFVPALTGLGAPYWSPDSRGIIVGLTRSTNNLDILKAIVQSLVFSTNDILLESSKITALSELSCDGGVCVNGNMLQFLADITGLKIKVQTTLESTVLGAIFMAGLKCGAFKNLDDIKNTMVWNKTYAQKIDEKTKNDYIDGWNKAVKLCLLK